MRCPFCSAEKQPRVWTCSECGAHIQKPSKPPYQAGGWEWVACWICSLVAAFTPEVYPAEPMEDMIGVSAFVGAVAFAFSAAREQRRFAAVLGYFCLLFWTVFRLGLPLVYCAIILLIEQVIWRVKLARM